MNLSLFETDDSIPTSHVIGSIRGFKGVQKGMVVVTRIKPGTPPHIVAEALRRAKVLANKKGKK